MIRPSWLFGERDRTTIPRLIQEFRWHRVSIVGKGDNPLSAVYAGVVADAALLAARDPGSVGEAYNITSHSRITQREFLDMLADAIGVPRVTWHYPFWYAFYGGLSLEIRERLLHGSEAAAGHAVRGLAPGPLPGVQHGEGAEEAGLGPCPDLPGEHRADDPLVPGGRARRGCPTTGCRPWSGSASGSATSERRWRRLGIPLPGWASLAADREAQLAEPARERRGQA